MIERAQAQINFSALQHNLQRVKSFAPNKSVLAMIKANGYGHGAVCVAKTLDSADAFGVACLEEARILRDAGITHPIVLMTGIASAEELIAAKNLQLELVVHHASQLDLLQQSQLKNPMKVWLKIDTGMHRLGFAPEKIPETYQRLMNLSSVLKPIGLMTHFADADDPEKSTTQQQLSQFNSITASLEGPKSIANSAGIIAWPKSHADWVRPGIMLYGVSPLLNRNAVEFDLQPVMTLSSKIIAINFLRKGDAIGYGGTWKCLEDMPVGVVAIGYGDGYPRHAKNGTPVLINGIKCPLVGRVSMDVITIDLRNYPSAKIGDRVTLWGKNLPIEEIASCANTIAYQLLCGVTQRVKFVFEE